MLSQLVQPVHSGGEYDPQSVPYWIVVCVLVYSEVQAQTDPLRILFAPVVTRPPSADELVGVNEQRPSVEYPDSSGVDE